MSFWQENYGFIKDVFDSRAKKMSDLMDAMDKSILDILADKIYTSAEFKKVKEVFMGLARNLEQPEVKDWLTETKDQLMGDKSAKEKDTEGDKVTAIITRFDEMTVKTNDTKKAVNALWVSYQFTDELAPLTEWIEENMAKSTRDINTNSASQTEDLQEKAEKVLDQLDKKRKVYTDNKAKGEKLLTDPKAPKFLQGHLDKLNELWKEANTAAEKRLKDLKDNLVSWEKYERERDSLADKLAGADTELVDTKKVFCMDMGPKDHADRVKTAAVMRKDIEGSFTAMVKANETLNQLLEDDMKMELGEQVNGLKDRLAVLNDMDAKLIRLNEFNGQLKVYDGQLKESEQWLGGGRARMDELIKPEKPMEVQERVMATMELQTDVQLKGEEFTACIELWEDGLKPTENGENTDEAQGFQKRIDTIKSTLDGLLAEAKTECEKYGEDVKYLADFTGAMKKFEPWIAKSEAKKTAGMVKPTNLQEAQDQLAAAQKWQSDAVTMKTILEEGKTAAQKMTLHEDADAKYDAYSKRWVVIEATTKEWIAKLDKMAAVWKKQTDTAAQVTAAINAKPVDGAPEMKLEDLEKHLDALKQMFIEKQKMMDNLDKEEPPAAPAAEPAPAAPAPVPEPAAAVAT